MHNVMHTTFLQYVAIYIITSTSDIRQKPKAFLLHVTPIASFTNLLKIFADFMKYAQIHDNRKPPQMTFHYMNIVKILK